MSAIPNYFRPWLQPAAAIVPVPDPLDGADLPDALTPDPSPAGRGAGERAEGTPEPLADSRVVGWIEVECTVVEGPLDLDVSQDPDYGWIEIGPFRLRPAEARQLLVLLREFIAAAGVWRHLGERRAAPPAESGRGIAGWDLAAYPGDRPACTGDRPVAPTMSRNPTGRAPCPPWEGETLP